MSTTKKPAKKDVKKVAKKVAKKAAAKKKDPVCVPTDASVDGHIGAIADTGRRQDCRTLVEVFGNATGKPAKMWGGSIVAFGKAHYKYASGREGDTCLAGFASRKSAITLYLMDAIEGRKDLMAKIGKYKTGKGCIYLKDLDGVDLEALGELVKHSADYTRAKYPDIA